jgi:hypothetical protein
VTPRPHVRRRSVGLAPPHSLIGGVHRHHQPWQARAEILRAFPGAGVHRRCGVSTAAPGTLPPIKHGHACPVPAEVVRSRLARGRHELLVRWTGLRAADASWVELDEFHRPYPDYQLKDELIVRGGGEMSCGAPSTSAGPRSRRASEGGGATRTRQ